MNPLADEIHEIGRQLAELIGPGTAIERARRSEIRALLREAFLNAQGDCTEDRLTGLRDKLRLTYFELLGPEDRRLLAWLARHERFGAVDRALVARRADYTTVGQRCADAWVDVLEARVNRTLATLTRAESSEDSDQARPMRSGNENRELVVSKLT